MCGDIMCLAYMYLEVLDVSKIFLVRHGQTDANLHHIVQGQKDTPLNETGEMQAEKVAEKLKNRKTDLIISSDLKRAKQTAKTISQICGVRLVLDKRLREMNLGIWEGKSFEYVENDPSAKIWRQKPSEWKIEGSETVMEVQSRMIEVISEFSEKYENLVVVSHGIAISTFLIYSKDLSLDSMWEYLPDNTSTIEVKVDFSVEQDMK